jgi:hypothetical protein
MQERHAHGGAVRSVVGAVPASTGLRREHRVEAAECALPVGPVQGLDQGEEPGQPGDDPGARERMVTLSGSPNTKRILFAL